MSNKKALDVTSVEDAVSTEKVNDINVVGNGDMFKLLCKASSKSQGWMKSTKAMEVSGLGCVVQVTTQQGDNVAEALTFVPGVRIVDDENGGRRLEVLRFENPKELVSEVPKQTSPHVFRTC